jgi:DNA polymerase-3 subunit alpha
VRAEQGGIGSLYRLCEDVDLRLVNKRVLESLAKAGALDGLAGGVPPSGGAAALRPRLVAAADGAQEYGNRFQRDREEGQGGLFGLDETAAAPSGDVALPPAPAWTDAQQLAAEKEALGLYLSGHPIDRYAEALRAFGARSLADLLGGGPADVVPGDEEDGTDLSTQRTGRVSEDVAIGGVVTGLRQLKTRKGDRMAAFVLEDPHGTVEVVVFPDAFSKAGSLLQADAPVLVRGRFERDEDSTRVLASEILSIDTVPETVRREVVITLRIPPASRNVLEGVSDILGRHPGDRRVVFILELRGAAPPLRVRLDVSGQVRVRPSDRLAAEVDALCGAGTVTLR